MPSFKNCAALAATLAVATASPHGHAARAIHQKKDLPSYGNIVPAQPNGQWFREGVLNGLNPTSGAIAMNNTEGDYVVEFINTRTDSDVDLVLWSAYNQASSWSTLTINVTPPNITTTIPAGSNMSVSFNPKLYTAEHGFPGAFGSISGAWCGMFNDTPISNFGGCNDTWGEWTTQPGPWSTFDVSRLVNMNGHNMTITTHATKDSAPACTSDFERCVYKCANGASTCPAGDCSNCNGNTGCMGMVDTGYIRVYMG